MSDRFPHRHHFFVFLNGRSKKEARDSFIHLSERICRGEAKNCTTSICFCEECNEMGHKWLQRYAPKYAPKP
jgi:hypothetical protein